jgi:hypothetical protein
MLDCGLHDASPLSMFNVNFLLPELKHSRIDKILCGGLLMNM